MQVDSFDKTIINLMKLVQTTIKDELYIIRHCGPTYSLIQSSGI